MPALKIALELSSLNLPLPEALKTAARLGVEGVEIDARRDLPGLAVSQTALRELRRRLEDLHLKVSTLRFRTRRSYYASADLEARIDATKQAMRLAYALGATLVCNQIGRVPSDANSPEWGLLVEVVNDLGDFGHRVGARLAAETGSESGPELARLLAALHSNAIGVDFNPGNLLLGGFDAMEAVAELGPSILHVRLVDAAVEPVGRGRYVPLGQGMVDIPTLLGALGEFGYQGWFTLGSLSPTNPVGEITAAAEYLRDL
jgi:sugar phosphate isomerase/epimerase